MSSSRRAALAALIGVSCVALTLFATPETLAAELSWKKPDSPPALGLLALQCDRSEFCFAVACPGGKLQLVNISPGGGPYGSPEAGQKGDPATLMVAGKSYSLAFVWDNSILDLYGNAGSRTSLPVEALTALAENDGRISGTASAPRTATIYSQGLRQLWPALGKPCKLQALPKR